MNKQPRFIIERINKNHNTIRSKPDALGRDRVLWSQHTRRTIPENGSTRGYEKITRNWILVCGGLGRVRFFSFFFRVGDNDGLFVQT